MNKHKIENFVSRR